MRLSILLTVFLLSVGSGSAKDASALCEAVEAGDVATAQKLLAEGAGIESRNDKGWTPLIVAANATNAEMAKLLIEKGADVNAKSSSAIGSTVLCFATQSDDPKFIDLFLQHGATLNARSKNGATPLYAAVAKKKENATKFLISKGAKVDQLAFLNERGRLWTPLMSAAEDGDLHLTELLMASGASLEKRNNWGETVLMHVARLPESEMIRFLVKRGANVNAKTPDGHTALIYAANAGETENVRVLLAAGADPNARWSDSNYLDEPGHDATFYPGINHDEETVVLIREAQRKSNQDVSKH